MGAARQIDGERAMLRDDRDDGTEPSPRTGQGAVRFGQRRLGRRDVGPGRIQIALVHRRDGRTDLVLPRVDRVLRLGHRGSDADHADDGERSDGADTPVHATAHRAALHVDPAHRDRHDGGRRHHGRAAEAHDLGEVQHHERGDARRRRLDRPPPAEHGVGDAEQHGGRQRDAADHRLGEGEHADGSAHGDQQPRARRRTRPHRERHERGAQQPVDDGMPRRFRRHQRTEDAADSGQQPHRLGGRHSLTVGHPPMLRSRVWMLRMGRSAHALIASPRRTITAGECPDSAGDLQCANS